MIPWVHLDMAAVPGGGAFRLLQRGGEFSIMAGNITLMNSRMSGSEIALADLAQGPRHSPHHLGGHQQVRSPHAFPALTGCREASS